VIAQSNCPPTAAQSLHARSRGVHEMIRLLPDFFGEHHQELLAAARSQQHFRQAELGNQRAATLRSKD